MRLISPAQKLWSVFRAFFTVPRRPLPSQNKALWNLSLDTRTLDYSPA